MGEGGARREGQSGLTLAGAGRPLTEAGWEGPVASWFSCQG